MVRIWLCRNSGPLHPHPARKISRTVSQSRSMLRVPQVTFSVHRMARDRRWQGPPMMSVGPPAGSNGRPFGSGHAPGCPDPGPGTSDHALEETQATGLVGKRNRFATARSLAEERVAKSARWKLARVGDGGGHPQRGRTMENLSISRAKRNTGLLESTRGISSISSTNRSAPVSSAVRDARNKTGRLHADFLCIASRHSHWRSHLSGDMINGMADAPGGTVCGGCSAT